MELYLFKVYNKDSETELKLEHLNITSTKLDAMELPKSILL